MAKSWSKWSKHKLLRKHSDVASSLPETHWMSKTAFNKIISKYGRVVLKPIQKSGGKGIILVAKQSDNSTYKVKTGRSSRTLASSSSAWSYIKKKKASKYYIVQRYIRLLRVGGKPFDIRVMVQRKKGQPWVVTGKLAKVAGAGHFITNMRRSHGNIVSVRTALQRSPLKSSLRSKELHSLDAVSLRISRHLGRSYPSIHTIGLDMGIDQKGKVWFIEANFRPMLSLFRRLNNKSIYTRITKYTKK